VLVRRAIEPGYGKWVYPGGYVDRGELVKDAAVREAREEAGPASQARPPDQRVLIPWPLAGDHRLRGVDSSAARSAPTTSASKPGSSSRTRSRGASSPFPSTNDALREYLASRVEGAELDR
jgi:hypothetical protein